MDFSMQCASIFLRVSRKLYMEYCFATSMKNGRAGREKYAARYISHTPLTQANSLDPCVSSIFS